MISAQLIANEQEAISAISKKVKNRSILLVTEQIVKPQCTYSVIGHYLFYILKAAGADVKCVQSSPKLSLSQKFDLGIYSHYETLEYTSSRRRSFRVMRQACKKLVFYANIVPFTHVSWDAYFVSRECFLDANNKWYNWWQYCKPKPSEMNKARFVGRGVDPYILKPKQREFLVSIDARFKGPLADARKIKYLLESHGFTVHPIGFLDKVDKTPKLKFSSIASVYNSSSVYISTIPGIYEMPVIESQCAGNAVISFKNCLPTELCCPESSYFCNSAEEVLNAVQKIRENHNSDIPRGFVSQMKWTNIVMKMIDYLY